MDLLTQIIGFLAVIVGTLIMLPQVIKTIKTKKAADISLIMLIFYFLSCSLWLIYGVLLLSWPLIICNFIVLIISIVQIILKFRFQ
ncbi:hypothetical protein D4R87_03385 [bacterium]|nr:MAG: hypothetical protein D4R87_03385 [bacterium]